MLRRCTRCSGVSRTISTSLRRSLSMTSAARVSRLSLSPWAIAARCAWSRAPPPWRGCEGAAGQRGAHVAHIVQLVAGARACSAAGPSHRIRAAGCASLRRTPPHALQRPAGLAGPAAGAHRRWRRWRRDADHDAVQGAGHGAAGAASASAMGSLAAGLCREWARRRGLVVQIVQHALQHQGGLGGVEVFMGAFFTPYCCSW